LVRRDEDALHYVIPKKLQAKVKAALKN